MVSAPGSSAVVVFDGGPVHRDVLAPSALCGEFQVGHRSATSPGLPRETCEIVGRARGGDLSCAMQQTQIACASRRGHDEGAAEEGSTWTQSSPQAIEETRDIIDEVEEAEANHGVESVDLFREIKGVGLEKPDAGTHAITTGNTARGARQHVAGTIGHRDRTAAPAIGLSGGGRRAGRHVQKRPVRGVDGPLGEGRVVAWGCRPRQPVVELPPDQPVVSRGPSVVTGARVEPWLGLDDDALRQLRSEHDQDATRRCRRPVGAITSSASGP